MPDDKKTRQNGRSSCFATAFSTSLWASERRSSKHHFCCMQQVLLGLSNAGVGYSVGCYSECARIRFTLGQSTLGDGWISRRALRFIDVPERRLHLSRQRRSIVLA